jgi:HEAT repeat protein
LAHAPAVKHLGLYEGLLRGAETQAALGKNKAALAIYNSLQKSTVPFQIRGAALRSIIVMQGPDNPVLLRQCLKSDDYLVFGAAVQAALELPSPKITRTLSAAITQQTPDFQVLLAAALGNRADVSALPTLHTLAEKGNKGVRLAAMKALSQIGHASTTPVLVTLCEDRDPAIAQSAKDRLAASVCDA